LSALSQGGIQQASIITDGGRLDALEGEIELAEEL
jgi:hypothetical protein